MPKLNKSNKNFDLSLYLVTDPKLTSGISIFTIIEQALTGGATMVQLRNKEASQKEFLQQARQVKIITKKYNVPLIINDNIEVARKIDASGVHLGQDDLPLLEAKKMLGDEKIFGLSVSSLEEAKEAEKAGADYLGIGPIFPTETKKDAAEPIGLKKLKEIVEAITVTSVAIGSINLSNIEQVAATGVGGVAVISALTLAENVKKTAKDLRENFLKASFITR